MIKKLISKDWYFSNGEGYKKIDLPHDYAIGKKRSADVPGGASNGFFPDSEGVYVKHLSFDEGKRYVLDIDGAYMCTQIFFNESHIASHPYGYSPFLVDLTPHIINGCTNKLLISTNPPEKSTRWYSGNGIYRDVFLWEGGDVRIGPWDMFVVTDGVTYENGKAKSAEVRLSYKIIAEYGCDATVAFTVISPMGNEVLKEERKITLVVGENGFEDRITVDSPLLWDTETPNLYTLKTEIFVDGKLTDTSENVFGIRTVTADAENGLLLNGRKIKLRGGCIHHDHGVLGAMAFPAAEERKIRLLRESGFNAVRCAHNPPSLALLEACDRLGVIVMDEAFDMWNKRKSQNDYHLFFEDWCLRDITYMVKRDRNHPCVISYSIGNEIMEIDGTYGAAEWSEKLSCEIRKHDTTRFVTSGIQKIFAVGKNAEHIDPEDYKAKVRERFHLFDVPGMNSVTKGYEAPLDIIGCNYYYKNYEEEHKCYPERVLWGSETHAITFYDSWKSTMEKNYVIGDFTWTAIDNMGEVGTGRSSWARDGVIRGINLAGYPWRTCYQGDLDLCGYRRPQSYFRESVWIGNREPRIFTTHPEHFGEEFSGTGWHWYDVDESWTYGDEYEGKQIKVETYTDADLIVWYVNGKKIGESVPEKGIASIDTVYEKGEFTAAAYKNGEEVSSYTLKTAKAPEMIEVHAESDVFKADNRDLCYFDISVTDGGGILIPDAKNELVCSVSGGELLGIYSGDPCNEDHFTSNVCHAFKGRALAVVRTDKAGKVTVKISSEGLTTGICAALAE